MIFRQLFESDSSSYTYLLACPRTREAVLIDPVLETLERDLQVLSSLGLTLSMALETHIHADHLTSARLLRQRTGCKVAGAAQDELPCRDVGIREGEPVRIGDVALAPLYTPGHTDTHHAYLFEGGTQKLLFTGDALLIEACGRTDFQSGDAATLYRSIHDKFFSLPDETLVYPAHDYEHRFVSTIAQEKQRNPRLGNNRSKEEFVSIMNGLKLPYPRRIDLAVPGNQLCGQCPDHVPPEMRAACNRQDQG